MIKIIINNKVFIVTDIVHIWNSEYYKFEQHWTIKDELREINYTICDFSEALIFNRIHKLATWVNAYPKKEE